MSQAFNDLVYKFIYKNSIGFLCGMKTVPKHIVTYIFTRFHSLTNVSNFYSSWSTAPSVSHLEPYVIKKIILNQKLHYC